MKEWDDISNIALNIHSKEACEKFEVNNDRLFNYVYPRVKLTMYKTVKEVHYEMLLKRKKFKEQSYTEEECNNRWTDFAVDINLEKRQENSLFVEIISSQNNKKKSYKNIALALCEIIIEKSNQEQENILRNLENDISKSYRIEIWHSYFKDIINETNSDKKTETIENLFVEKNNVKSSIKKGEKVFKEQKTIIKEQKIRFNNGFYNSFEIEKEILKEIKFKLKMKKEIFDNIKKQIKDFNPSIKGYIKKEELQKPTSNEIVLKQAIKKTLYLKDLFTDNEKYIEIINLLSKENMLSKTDENTFNWYGDLKEPSLKPLKLLGTLAYILKYKKYLHSNISKKQIAEAFTNSYPNNKLSEAYYGKIEKELAGVSYNTKSQDYLDIFHFIKSL